MYMANDDLLKEIRKIKAAKSSGRDERYEEDFVDQDLLCRIETNIIKLQLLNELTNPKISLSEKSILINSKKHLFYESGLTYNLSAGGLWDDFNTDISL